MPKTLQMVFVNVYSFNERGEPFYSKDEKKASHSSIITKCRIVFLSESVFNIIIS